jgi:lysophospholipase L1-like esterase
MENKSPSVIENTIVFLVTVIIMAFALEGIFIFQNANGKNYDIEMWKYSRNLKFISPYKALGHEHIPSKSAKLQNVDISINSLGMRGPEPKQNADIKIMMLGSSITLGWGVSEDQIYTSILKNELQARSPKTIEIFNAGVGNYNTSREVEAFFIKHKKLNPNIIVLNYFVNDAEILTVPKPNWLLENSQLAVLLWSRIEQIKTKFGVQESFEEHYRNIYKDNFEGWINTKNSFAKLAKYSKEKNIPVIVAMIPDIHNLKNYPFCFIHEKIKKLSEDNGFVFIDSYESFKFIEKPELIWAMPGDPHPNAKGHKLIADQLSLALGQYISQ